MATSAETDQFMKTHSMIDCQRMAARITAAACISYQKNNDALACVGCSRCAPGEVGRAEGWLDTVQDQADLLNKS